MIWIALMAHNWMQSVWVVPKPSQCSPVTWSRVFIITLLNIRSGRFWARPWWCRISRMRYHLQFWIGLGNQMKGRENHPASPALIWCQLTDGLSQSQPAPPNPDMMPSSQPSSAEWAKLAEVLGIQAAYSIQAHSPLHWLLLLLQRRLTWPQLAWAGNLLIGQHHQPSTNSPMATYPNKSYHRHTTLLGHKHTLSEIPFKHWNHNPLP